MPSLQGVADQAMTHASHYRFFMDSHGDQPSNCTSGWCAGETSTVCSSFCRSDATDASLTLWPTRSPGDKAPDGMRAYDVATRTAAGNALFGIVYNNVQSEVPG